MSSVNHEGDGQKELYRAELCLVIYKSIEVYSWYTARRRSFICSLFIDTADLRTHIIVLSQSCIRNADRDLFHVLGVVYTAHCVVRTSRCDGSPSRVWPDFLNAPVLYRRRLLYDRERLK